MAFARRRFGLLASATSTIDELVQKAEELPENTSEDERTVSYDLRPYDLGLSAPRARAALAS